MLISAPPSPCKEQASLGKQVVSGTPLEEGLCSIGERGLPFQVPPISGEGWVCLILGALTNVKLSPPSWFLHLIKVTFGLDLPLLCLHFQIIQNLGRKRGADQISDLLENYSLCLLFKNGSRILMQEPPTKFHDYIHRMKTPLQAGLCAWLPGRKPCILDKIAFSSLQILMSLLLSSPLLPLPAGCLCREKSSLLSLDSQATKVTDSPSVLAGRHLTPKSLPAKLNPISYPGLSSWYHSLTIASIFCLNFSQS